jgi:hypothetical protein
MTYANEALPLEILQFACGIGCIGTSVDKVGNCKNCDYHTKHGLPPFCLSLNIDSQITAEMFIGFFAFKILFTGIYVPAVIIFEVVFGFIFTHG